MRESSPPRRSEPLDGTEVYSYIGEDTLKSIFGNMLKLHYRCIGKIHKDTYFFEIISDTDTIAIPWVSQITLEGPKTLPTNYFGHIIQCLLAVHPIRKF